MKRLVLGLLAGTLVLGPVSACDDVGGPCACTEEFRVFLVTLVDQAGVPVTDASLTRTNLRTGAALEPVDGWLGLVDEGAYVVADDNMIAEFSSAGDRVLVEGANGAGTLTFSAEFRFAVPQPCACHVEKLAGPDTVVMVSQ
ncbi:MAG TPA: hypothetical protein VGA22_08005 [Gemmatimonadales bacterium]|jgi:hypothetical protein